MVTDSLACSLVVLVPWRSMGLQETGLGVLILSHLLFQQTLLSMLLLICYLSRQMKSLKFGLTGRSYKFLYVCYVCVPLYIYHMTQNLVLPAQFFCVEVVFMQIFSVCSFEFRLRITLGPGGDLMLTSRIRNTNTDGKPFSFTFAYHTYFSVSDIRYFGKFYPHLIV